MFSSELIHIFLYKFLEPRWFVIERSNLCISRIANFILILQMNLYHEIIHAKDVMAGSNENSRYTDSRKYYRKADRR